MMIFRIIRLPLALIAAVSISALACAADQAGKDLLSFLDCGSIENGYGPFDYTNASDFKYKLPIVESNHFNSDVESLRKGMSSVYPGADLDYTLRAFPNHHRALNSMANLARQYGAMRVPPGARYSGECYFQRALRFQSDDSTVRVIYGIYLIRQKKIAAAKEQFVKAVRLEPGSAEAHYNLGLVYEKMGDDQLAMKHAIVAYDLGFPLPGLRSILERKGVWNTD